jgi:hypothetical protein
MPSQNGLLINSLDGNDAQSAGGDRSMGYRDVVYTMFYTT